MEKPKHNPVAKFAGRFNRASTHKDRKRASKRVRGHKHKATGGSDES